MDSCNEQPALLRSVNMPAETETVLLAAAQLPARPMKDAAAGLVDIEQAAQAASQAGARLVVLPECCYPCYWLDSGQGYFEANILRGPAVEAFFGDLARRHRIYIVAGLVHDSSGRLYDAAVLFDPAGQVVGRHFKTFLWDREHEWYEPGDVVQPVDTAMGRIGMLVCAEGRSPEVFASHASQGAGLLTMPTAWVNAAAESGRFYNPQPDYMIRARAIEFGLPMVCANKFGQECEDARFCGMSLIVGADGQVLAQAGADGPALLTAEVPVAVRQLILPDATARRLLEAQPVLPARDAQPARVALLPGLLIEPYDQQDVQQLLVPLASQGVSMAVACCRQSEWEIGSEDASAAAVRLVTELDIGYTIRASGITAGCVAARQVESFALPRIMALDGAQVLCVLGQWSDLSTLRVRAAENRVFVLGVSQQECVAIAPNGVVLAQRGIADKGLLTVELDLAQAADKMVARSTDVWSERRPKAYRLRR